MRPEFSLFLAFCSNVCSARRRRRRRRRPRDPARYSSNPLHKGNAALFGKHFLVRGVGGRESHSWVPGRGS
uniref:Putative secreted peptide n=1 Tax=Anopheles braziliensis TaxID=58242 RepID=A0A2M3ZWI2_9DIPT